VSGCFKGFPLHLRRAALHEGSGPATGFPTSPCLFPLLPPPERRPVDRLLLPGTPRNTLVAPATGSGSKPSASCCRSSSHCRSSTSQGPRDQGDPHSTDGMPWPPTRPGASPIVQSTSIRPWPVCAQVSTSGLPSESPPTAAMTATRRTFTEQRTPLHKAPPDIPCSPQLPSKLDYLLISRHVQGPSGPTNTIPLPMATSTLRLSGGDECPPTFAWRPRAPISCPVLIRPLRDRLHCPRRLRFLVFGVRRHLRHPRGPESREADAPLTPARSSRAASRRGLHRGGGLTPEESFPPTPALRGIEDKRGPFGPAPPLPGVEAIQQARSSPNATNPQDLTWPGKAQALAGRPPCCPRPAVMSRLRAGPAPWPEARHPPAIHNLVAPGRRHRSHRKTLPSASPGQLGLGDQFPRGLPLLLLGKPARPGGHARRTPPLSSMDSARSGALANLRLSVAAGAQRMVASVEA